MPCGQPRMAASSAFSISMPTHSSPWSGTRPAPRSVWCSEPSRRPRNGTSSSSGDSGRRLRSMEIAWPSLALVRTRSTAMKDGFSMPSIAARSASSITSSRSVRVSALAPALASARDQPIASSTGLPSKVTKEPMPTLVVISPRLDSSSRPLRTVLRLTEKRWTELVLALQPVAEAEHAGADFVLENGRDLLGLARAGRQLNHAPLHMGTCSVNLYNPVQYWILATSSIATICVFVRRRRTPRCAVSHEAARAGSRAPSPRRRNGPTGSRH